MADEHPPAVPQNESPDAPSNESDAQAAEQAGASAVAPQTGAASGEFEMDQARTIAQLEGLAAGVGTARSLVNEPANLLGPEDFVRRARAKIIF